MLIKRSERQARHGALSRALQAKAESGIDRRAFLRRSGLTVGGLAGLGALPLAGLRTVQAGAPPRLGAQVTMRKGICTFCSVSCTIAAEVASGVWIGQEPAWESPFNRGSYCAKGAAARETVHGNRRLKYPMKLINGHWVRINWETAINEIGDQLTAIRERSGADSVYWMGSAKLSNENAYLYRKLAAFWGTNNVDHCARICHSTTVAGLGNTWGYGAMTSSFNDIRNSKTILILGGNPAEAHPVAMQHILEGRELSGANLIVADPRLTRTAAQATDYVRMRPGTDIPLIYGMLWHIFKNGWEDKQFISQRVYGMDDVRREVDKWTPDEVERVTGIPEQQVKRIAQAVATQKPACLVWAMGQTQHTVGTANVRASCILLLATGNAGNYGSGANPFRGHDNVQGATDMGLDVTTLPLYYGLAEEAWKHWSRVWEVDLESLRARFDDPKLMTTSGIPEPRWFDAVTLPKDRVEQKDNLRAMVVFGHSPQVFTRTPQAASAMEKLELLVVGDPHPTNWAALSGRKNGTYLLPICTQFESRGSRTASNRSLQWYEPIVNPLFETKADGEVFYRFAKKLGFADQMFKNIKVENDRPEAEDVLREINRGGWSTGYTGQSPERLKAHMRNQEKFDMLTLRAPKDGSEVSGDYYGLPWPCWGTPDLRHPGTPLLYNTHLHVMEGGGAFRARFGVEREVTLPDGSKRIDNLLAEGSYPVGSDIKDGYPEFTFGMLKKLGWDKDLTSTELALIERIGAGRPDTISWSTDLSGGIQRVALAHGCNPCGNAKARANAWSLPDPIPVHREPIYTPRPDLVAKYPTRANAIEFRVPNIGFELQKSAVERGIAKQFPLVLTSGRLVEYEGGGEETRSNKWLAEQRQDMFIEINPADAVERGIKHRSWVNVSGPEMPSGKASRMKAVVTERMAKGVVWCPFHFAGWFMGVDQRSKYPKGIDPIVLGEPVNAITTYGYDPVTGMQEPKATLCQIRAA